MPTPRLPRGPLFTVDVTDKAVTDAIGRDSRHCMIAEAIKAIRPDAARLSVDIATIRFTDPVKGLRYSYMTPRTVQVQLVKFDQGIKPEPFSFQLRNAHVTRAGNSTKRALTNKPPSPQKLANLEKMRAGLARTILSNRGEVSRVPDRIGGSPPPLQLSGDGVPFSRRRAFGLRALEY